MSEIPDHHMEQSGIRGRRWRGAEKSQSRIQHCGKPFHCCPAQCNGTPTGNRYQKQRTVRHKVTQNQSAAGPPTRPLENADTVCQSAKAAKSLKQGQTTGSTPQAATGPMVTALSKLARLWF
jgi:hypothetical protein